MKNEFKELQRFAQWYLWAFLIALGVLPLYAIYKRFLSAEPLLINPFKDLALLFFAILIFGLICLFYRMKLITLIDKREIQIIFKPFVTKTVKWIDIEEIKIVDYGFVGGWGIRYGSKYGTVYNTSGRIGLFIRTRKGERFVVGTKKQNELYKVIKENYEIKKHEN